MKIALDVEGVLADSHRAGRARSSKLNKKNCPPPDWSFADEDMLDHYLHVTQNLWHNHNEDIEPMPQPEGWDLGWATKRLSKFHDVDVVTNRTGVDEQIEEWLDRHNIHRDEFKAISGNKTGAGEYDVFVDDSPHVIQDALDYGANAIIIDRPYNQDVSPHTVINRVGSVTEATEVLVDVPGPRPT